MLDAVAGRAPASAQAARASTSGRGSRSARRPAGGAVGVADHGGQRRRTAAGGGRRARSWPVRVRARGRRRGQAGRAGRDHALRQVAAGDGVGEQTQIARVVLGVASVKPVTPNAASWARRPQIGWRDGGRRCRSQSIEAEERPVGSPAGRRARRRRACGLRAGGRRAAQFSIQSVARCGAARGPGGPARSRRAARGRGGRRRSRGSRRRAARRPASAPVGGAQRAREAPRSRTAGGPAGTDAGRPPARSGGGGGRAGRAAGRRRARRSRARPARGAAASMATMVRRRSRTSTPRPLTSARRNQWQWRAHRATSMQDAGRVRLRAAGATSTGGRGGARGWVGPPPPPAASTAAVGQGDVEQPLAAGRAPRPPRRSRQQAGHRVGHGVGTEHRSRRAPTSPPATAASSPNRGGAVRSRPWAVIDSHARSVPPAAMSATSTPNCSRARGRDDSITT